MRCDVMWCDGMDEWNGMEWKGREVMGLDWYWIELS